MYTATRLYEANSTTVLITSDNQVETSQYFKEDRNRAENAKQPTNQRPAPFVRFKSKDLGITAYINAWTTRKKYANRRMKDGKKNIVAKMIPISKIHLLPRSSLQARTQFSTHDLNFTICPTRILSINKTVSELKTTSRHANDMWHYPQRLPAPTTSKAPGKATTPKATPGINPNAPTPVPAPIKPMAENHVCACPRIFFLLMTSCRSKVEISLG